MLSVIVRYEDKKYTFPKGVSLLDISKEFQSNFKDKIIVGKIDGSVTELSTKVFNNCKVDFYDKNSSVGNKVYESGLMFLLVKSFKDLYDEEVKIDHSLDTGIYIKTNKKINDDILLKVKDRINELISLDLPIDKLLINRKEAIKYAIEHGEPGDIIVLAGKGHEDYQEIKGVKYPMDERVLIKEVLEELKGN